MSAAVNPHTAYHIAHSILGTPPERWELLEDRLRRVGELGERFAGALYPQAWCECAEVRCKAMGPRSYVTGRAA